MGKYENTSSQITAGSAMGIKGKVQRRNRVRRARRELDGLTAVFDLVGASSSIVTLGVKRSEQLHYT